MNKVEQDVLVEAPIGIVWDVVTRPEHIGAWFLDSEVNLEATAGGAGSISFVSREGTPVKLALEVERAEAPHLLAFRWNGHPGQPQAVTHVEFQLSEEGSATRLRVRESGFAELGLDETAATAYREGHIDGWGFLVPAIAKRAAAVPTEVA
ncbi:MAG: SRPBCC domain-containing protein [Solirubrobacterales bacterium]|nr:SRPBCC domain-containing protein [Solirubrobacterales bacterium]